MKDEIFIFSGEPSGDLLGASLLKTLKEQLPQISFFGVPGPQMREIGLEPICMMEEFQVMGFSDVFCALPKLFKLFYQIAKKILEHQPKAVILIDYPDFNLRLAKKLRKKGYKGKIIQYVSPSVWAWRKKRIEFMEKYYDLLLTIYPFEPTYFSHTSLKAVFVGNPVQERIEKNRKKYTYDPFLGVKEDQTLVAIYPGSRKEEVIRNFSKQQEIALQLFQKNPQIVFGISCTDSSLESFFSESLKASSLPYFLVPKEKTTPLMEQAKIALAKSGTVTLELALHSCPTVVTYELSALNRFLTKNVLRLNLSHYCIANILAGKSVFPEFITKKIVPSEVAEEALNLLIEGKIRQECLNNCEKIKSILQGYEPSKNAAEMICKEIYEYN